MRKQDVPQDSGMLEDKQVLAYAVDEDGRYCTAPSSGWETVDSANAVAWEDIRRQLQQVRAQITARRRSPLAYYMVRAQMNTALLAAYSGVARWRVALHLRPRFFARLNEQQRRNYARLFKISTEQLEQLPEHDDLPHTSGGENG